MGDKSPKAKQRDDKQKNAAESKHMADAKAKQAGQSRFQKAPTKGGK